MGQIRHPIRNNHGWGVWHNTRVNSLLALLCICFNALLSPLLPSGIAQAVAVASSGPCPAARRGVNLALPAVVRLTTTFQAQLIYYNLDGSSVQFPQGGGSYQITVSGSGAFISSTGVALTASAVVGLTEDEQANLLLQRSAPDIAQALNSSHPSQTVTANDIYTLLLNTPDAWQGTYGQVQTSVFLSSQYTGPTTAASVDELRSFPASILAQGSPDQPVNNDLAIVQVAGVQDVPIVPLGEMSQVYQGDPLTVLGFPGTADLPSSNGVVDPNNFITASLENVAVSALKTTTDGSQVLLVDSALEQGESGGPALTADGQLVGVVSFAGADANSSGRVSLLSSVNDVGPLLQQAGIHLETGTFEKRWAAAYDACMSTAPGHWHDAATQFAALARAYPDVKGVQPYLNYARSQAAHEQVPNKTLLLLGGLAVAVVALAAVVAVILWIRRRRKALAGMQAQSGAFAGVGPGLNQEISTP
jgi:S1-C subfamily serine protease